ncbi:MAG: hypothetical protein AAFW46_01210 [Pseudomonadota bacterium]
MKLGQAMAGRSGGLAETLAAPTAHRLDVEQHALFMRFREHPYGCVVAFDEAPAEEAEFPDRRARLGEPLFLHAGYNAICAVRVGEASGRVGGADETLADVLNGLADSGALDAFRPLLGVGLGRGADAALSFADRLGFEDVLAIGPVAGPGSDWSARARLGPVSRLVIGWDPEDRHVSGAVGSLMARTPSATRVTALPTPGLGPDLSAAIRRRGLWTSLVTGFLAGGPNPSLFRRRLAADAAGRSNGRPSHGAAGPALGLVRAH